MKLKINNKDYIIVAILITLIVLTRFTVLEKQNNISVEVDKNESSISFETPEKIIIDISGEVEKPGIYEVIENTRLNEVVDKAGGLTEKADINRINLARVVEDGSKIFIPSIKVDVNNESDTSQTSERYTLTDFNSFSIEDLTKISGIGEVLAKRIIDYRDKNGSFTKISDLKNVSGIGDNKLKKIEEYLNK